MNATTLLQNHSKAQGGNLSSVQLVLTAISLYFRFRQFCCCFWTLFHNFLSFACIIGWTGLDNHSACCIEDVDVVSLFCVSMYVCVRLSSAVSSNALSSYVVSTEAQVLRNLLKMRPNWMQIRVNVAIAANANCCSWWDWRRRPQSK